MAEEEFFFLGKEGSGAGADEWSQGSGHLNHDQDENNGPDAKAAFGSKPQVVHAVEQEFNSEHGGDEPKDEVQAAHHDRRTGGLGEDPGDGCEADQENGHQGEGASEEPEDSSQPGLGAAQAGENVKARQTNEATNKHADN
ncbi:MAG: hypothetical protein JWM16_2718 [Verrucomicrobiales bacterium]|nr:hypothetical protein [Verrucomicrobiales bacterium]